jgi:hypothetical protein
VDEDEQTINMSFTSNMDDAESNPTPVIMEDGAPDDEDSSDDELLVNRKTLKKAPESKLPKKKPLKKTTVGGIQKREKGKCEKRLP